MTVPVLPIVRSTRADAKRSASKPNTARKAAIRYTLAFLPCMTCGLSVCWSHETRAFTGRDVPAYRAEIGHVVGEAIGGTYAPGNIGAQCHACNTAARDAGIDDQTGMTLDGTVPTRWTPTRVALDRADVRDVPALAVENQHTADDARVARARRGLTW